jgi:Resolvase, N terminal domain
MHLDALNKAGCKRIFTDKLSGAQVERPGLNEALSHLREADTLVVWKLDRLGRSVKGLVDLVKRTGSPEGAFPKHHRRRRHQDARRALLLSRNGEPSPNGAGADPGARTRAGLEAARCAGRVGGRKRQMTDSKFRPPESCWRAGRRHTKWRTA